MSGNESPLRLLHIFPSFEIGGAQSRFAQIVNHFGARFEHSVIALDGRMDARRLVNSVIRVGVAPLAYDKRSQLGSLWRFREELDSRPHDLLLTYNWGAVDWAFANRLRRASRHLHMEDGFGPDESDRQLRRRVWFRRVALTGAQTTVVVPSQTLQEIARDVWRLPASRLIYLPNGIDCTRFHEGARGPAPGQPIIVGTVATLRAEKNLSRLIRAFALLQSSVAARLLIVGDGAERPALERLAAELGLAQAVAFVGATPTPEHFYRQMHIFALSSDTEQMPYSVLEAMASGLPIVATKVGDIAHMVSDANRPFVVHDRSPRALADALGIFAREPALRARVGAENRKVATTRFDLNVMLAGYSSLFEGRRLERS